MSDPEFYPTATDRRPSSAPHRGSQGHQERTPLEQAEMDRIMREGTEEEREYLREREKRNLRLVGGVR